MARLRCAIYTRKSSEEGLDQAFNSLHAQREACEAYVKSQAGEGWTALTGAYDDGGISGATMEREGLRRLLADVEAGKIDIVVVYKVDRLTRSLSDFARIVDVFDNKGVSFVSVTQAFNTTTSMGRLTLNVLLSFAQFEREVTGERIRDKIAASKAKGLWMGGNPPLGYDPDGRTLKINAPEADLVRHIFRRYLELGSVSLLREELLAERRMSKAWTSLRGRAMGGLPFSRGALFHMLRNPVFIGQIAHKKTVYPGNHPPIVDDELFEAVQRVLKAGARRSGRSTDPHKALLEGMIFDAAGSVMSPTTSHGRGGRAYRYYVSAPLQQGLKRKGAPDAIRRIPAEPLEDWLRQTLARFFPAPPAEPIRLLRRIEVQPSSVQIGLRLQQWAPGKRERRLIVDTAIPHLGSGESLAEDGDLCWLHIPHRLQFRGGRAWTSGAADGLVRARSNAALTRGLKSAHHILAATIGHSGAVAQQPKSAHERCLIRLAFLAPDIQQAIVEGRQPPGLCLEDLRRQAIPLCWDDQRCSLGR